MKIKLQNGLLAALLLLAIAHQTTGPRYRKLATLTQAIRRVVDESFRDSRPGL
jgi:hypothetical protein